MAKSYWYVEIPSIDDLNNMVDSAGLISKYNREENWNIADLNIQLGKFQYIKQDYKQDYKQNNDF